MKRITVILFGGVILLAGLARPAAAADAVFSSAYLGGGNFDTSVGLSTSKTYLNAVNTGGGALTINGVSFAATSGNTPSGSNWSISGPTSNGNAGGANNVSGQLGSALQDFLWGGNTETLNLSGLTIGQTYVVTFYDRSWEAAGGRLQNITTFSGDFWSGFDEDFSAPGQGNGSLLRYTFKADATTNSVTFNAVANGTSLHLYGFSTEQAFNKSWVSGANWTTATWSPVGAPGGQGANASFGAQGAPTGITLDAPVTVGHVQFDGANAWTVSGANTLTLQADAGGVSVLSALSGTHTVSAPVSLQNAVAKFGQGTLVLSGVATGNQTVTIRGGALQLSGGADRLPTGAPLVLADAAGAALDLNGQNQTIASLAGGGSAGGNVLLGSGALTVGNANNTTFAGSISGGGSLTKTGSGSLTLGGTGTYNGGTTVSQGTLQSAAANAAGSGPVSVTGGAAWELGGDSHTIAGLAGAGNVTRNGVLTTGADGAAMVSPSKNYTLKLDFGNGGGATINGVAFTSVATTGTGWSLSGAATLYGETGVTGYGQLTSDFYYGGNSETLSFTGLTVGKAYEAVLYTEPGWWGNRWQNATFTNGSVSQQLLNTDPGTVGYYAYRFLANSTTASITMNAVSAGTTYHWFGASLEDLGVRGNSLTIGDANSYAFSGVISGPTALVKQGAGTQTLSGNNTYGGATTINSGTLQIGAGGAAGALGIGPVTDHGTLAFNRSDNIGITNSISGSGGLTKLAANTLTLSGVNSYAGSTVISAGTLALGGAGSSLVARYLFDGNANDGSGNGRNGTAVGSPPYSAGQFGRAVTLSRASSQYVTVAYNAAFGLNAFTVSAWVNFSIPPVYTADNSGNYGLVSTRSGGDTTFDMQYMQNSAGNYLFHGDVGTGSAWLNTSLDYTVGATSLSGWHMITYAMSASGYTIYLDGSQVATGSVGGTPLFMKSGETLVLGGASTAGNYMNGSLDDVVVVGRALTAAEVASLYAGFGFMGPASAVQLAGGASLDVNGVSPTIGSLADSGVGGGAVNNGAVSMPATLTLNPAAGSTMFSGAINNGAGTSTISLNKTGAGTQVLTGASTYTGPTAIYAGTLQLGDGASGHDGTLATSSVLDNGTLAYNLFGNQNVTYPISGSGALVKSGGGQLTLNGASITYTGGTTVNAGTLKLADATAFNSAVTMSGGTLELNGTTGMWTLSQPIAAGAGAGSLVKTGAGTVILSQAGTYSGGTTIAAGTLKSGAANATGPGAVSVTSGMTWDLGPDGHTIAGLTGGGAIVRSTALTTGADGSTLISTNKTYVQKLDFGNGAGATVNNVAFDSVATSGTGWSLSGAGTLYGESSPPAGYDRIINDFYYGGNPGVLTFRNLTVGQAYNIVLYTKVGTWGGRAQTATFTNGSDTQQLLNSDPGNYGYYSYRFVAGAATATVTMTPVVPANTFHWFGASLDTAPAPLTVGDAGNYQFDGVISGPTALVKQGGGQQILAGDNTYAGGTTINAGTLQVGAGGTSGLLGAGNVADNGALAFNRSDSIALANVISGSGSLTKAGGGVLTLANAQGYGGSTTISGGTLRLSSALAVSIGNYNFEAPVFGANGYAYTPAGATWTWVGSGSGAGVARNGSPWVSVAPEGAQVGYIQGEGATSQFSQSVTVGTFGQYVLSFRAANRPSYNADGLVFQVDGQEVGRWDFAQFNNSGSFVTKTLTLNLAAGSHTLAFLGWNGAGGDVATAIDNITLTAAAGQLASGTAVTITAAGGSLDLNDNNQAVASLTGVAGSTVTLGKAVLTVGNSSSTVFGGVISDSGGASSNTGGSLVKQGTGTLTLIGANTYTGATTINVGTLQLGDGTSGHDGTLATSGIVNNGTLAYNLFGNQAIAYPISGGGTLVKSGSGQLTLSGTGVAYTGATTVNAGTLTLSDATAFNSAVVMNGGTLELNGTTGSWALGQPIFAGTGAGSLLKSGAGTVTLTQTSTYTGSTTVAGGKLQQGTANALGSGALIVNNGYSVDLGPYNATIGGLDGSGNVTRSGAIGGPVYFTTNAGSGVSAAKTYTHLLDFGNGTGATVNAVAFNSVSTSGTGFTLAGATLQVGEVALNTPTFPDASNGTGMNQLFSDLNYNGNPAVLTLTGFTPGSTYEVRLYNRAYSTPFDRTQAFTFDPDGAGPISNQLTFNEDATTTPNYIGYQFVATASPLTVTTAMVGAGTYHWYGASAELVSSSLPTLTLGDVADHQFDGVLSGQGNVVKLGSGTQAFTAANTYTGTTTVNAGTLLANNTTGSATSTGAVTVSGGTFGGSGSVAGAVTVNSGKLAPGTASATGILTVNNNVTLASGVTFEVDLQGAGAGTGYDQLSLTGTLNLGGATLSLVVPQAYSPAVGTPFVIARGAALTGNPFANAAEGAELWAGKRAYVIHYDWSAGQVVLTARKIDSGSVFTIH